MSLCSFLKQLCISSLMLVYILIFSPNILYSASTSRSSYEEGIDAFQKGDFSRAMSLISRYVDHGEKRLPSRAYMFAMQDELDPDPMLVPSEELKGFIIKHNSPDPFYVVLRAKLHLMNFHPSSCHRIGLMELGGISETDEYAYAFYTLGLYYEGLLNPSISKNLRKAKEKYEAAKDKGFIAAEKRLSLLDSITSSLTEKSVGPVVPSPIRAGMSTDEQSHVIDESCRIIEGDTTTLSYRKSDYVPLQRNSHSLDVGIPALPLVKEASTRSLLDSEEMVTKHTLCEAERILFEYQLSSLGKHLKESIKDFPQVFISYAWSDETHKKWIERLWFDLGLVGFPEGRVLLDHYHNRPGQENNVFAHVDLIYRADKVIVVGSSRLKEKYENRATVPGGMVVHEIDILRSRIKEKGFEGIIPIYYEGEFKDSFPKVLHSIASRFLDRKSYFGPFFDLLVDIFYDRLKSVTNNPIQQEKEKLLNLLLAEPKILQEAVDKIAALKQERTEVHVKSARFILDQRIEQLKEEEIRGDEGKIESLEQAHYKAIEKLYEDASVKIQTSATNALLDAADAGDHLAMGYVSILHASGKGGLEKDKDKSLEYAIRSLEWIKKAAEGGKIQAQVLLGIMYINGRGVEKCEKEAEKWFRAAAAKGNANAQRSLGVMFECGHGVPKDYTEALKWYRMAATRNHAGAQYKIGEFFQNGLGIAKDEKEAINWYRLAAEQGYAPAQYTLGTALENGVGIEKNLTESVKWLGLAAKRGHKEAKEKMKKELGNVWSLEGIDLEDLKFKAEAGYKNAQYNLGVIYLGTRGELKDEAEAFKWLKLAAEQGELNAQHNVGCLYEKGLGVKKDKKEAFKWFKLAAEGNLAYAQFALGIMYDEGMAVAQNYTEAFKWFKLAAEQGYPSAQNALGNCYHYGKGVEKNITEVFRWRMLAATNGNAIAQCNIGIMYAKGEFVDRNNVEAFEWFKKSADQGFAPGISNLAGLYRLGNGTKKDGRLAYRLYKKAAELGEAHAQEYLGDMYYFGEEVAVNYEEAAKWWKLAAEQDNAEAQFSLGVLYSNGKGVIANMEESERWFSLAADQGHKKAKEYLEQLISEQNITIIQPWMKSTKHNSNTSLLNLNLSICFLTATINTTQVKFQEEIVKEDGDCGFTVLGLDRKEAFETLLAAKNRKDIRGLIAEEIKAAFISGDLPNDMKTSSNYDILSKAYESIKKDFDDEVRVLNDSLGVKDEERRGGEELIAYLAEQERTEDSLSLINKLITLTDIEKELNKYCLDESIYESYINNYLGKVGCLKLNKGSTSSLDALAKLKKLNVYVWSKNIADPTKLTLIHEALYGELGADATSQTVHMLHTKEGTHYNLLIKVDNEVNKPNAKILQKFSSLPILAERRNKELEEKKAIKVEIDKTLSSIRKPVTSAASITDAAIHFRDGATMPTLVNGSDAIALAESRKEEVDMVRGGAGRPEDNLVKVVVPR